LLYFLFFNKAEDTINIDAKYCENNIEGFNSFIESSKTCSPSNVICSNYFDMNGIITTNEIYYEIKGLESDKCIFYLKYNNVKLEYTEEFNQYSLSQGKTQEEIDEQFQQQKDSLDLNIGKDETCKLNQNDLTTMLNNWRDGGVSITDLNKDNCNGVLF